MRKWAVCVTVALIAALGVVDFRVRSSPPAATVALYGAGYASQEQPAPAGDNDRLAQLEAKVDKILKLLETLLEEEKRDDGPEKAQNQGQAQSPLAAGAGKCAGCHAPATAKKGGDFVLYEEKVDGLHFKQLSARGLQKVVREITDGSMPPKDSGVRLTPDERAALLATFQPPKGGK